MLGLDWPYSHSQPFIEVNVGVTLVIIIWFLSGIAWEAVIWVYDISGKTTRLAGTELWLFVDYVPGLGLQLYSGPLAPPAIPNCTRSAGS